MQGGVTVDGAGPCRCLPRPASTLDTQYLIQRLIFVPHSGRTLDEAGSTCEQGSIDA